MPEQVVIDDPSDIEDEYAFPYEELSEGDDEPADLEEAEIAAEEGIALSPEVIAQDIAEPIPSPYDGTITELCDDTIVSELPEKRDTLYQTMGYWYIICVSKQDRTKLSLNPEKTM